MARIEIEVDANAAKVIAGLQKEILKLKMQVNARDITINKMQAGFQRLHAAEAAVVECARELREYDEYPPLNWRDW